MAADTDERTTSQPDLAQPGLAQPGLTQPGLTAALGRMLAEREARIEALERHVAAVETALAERDARIAALQAEIAAQQAEIALLRADRATLHRLVHDLAWPDGPRSLRLALPVARLIRTVMNRCTATTRLRRD